MKQNNRVNVFFVATVSAIAHGALALAFMPLLSGLLLPVVSSAANTALTDAGMLLAALTPVLCAAMGFGLGAMMAFGYNTFVWALSPGGTGGTRREEVLVQQEEELVAQAAVGNAA